MNLRVGIEELEVSVSNKSGSFKTTAEYNDGILVVNSIKTYKKAFVKKDDWNQMVEFLEEAANFYQKKILLKKNQE